MKNIWIALCSAGIGGAERRALKLAIFLARETSYKVNIIVNENLFSFLKNDYQINEAIVNEEFKIYLAESYAPKFIDYKNYFGIIKKIDIYHKLLSKLPFIYRELLRYFSYAKLFSRLPIKSNDVIHCFGTDAARLGILFNTSIKNNKIIIELVGNKFLSRFSHHLKISAIENKNVVFKAVSKTVLVNFTNFLERDNLILKNQITEWDGPFIYFFDTDISNLDKENTIIFASRFNKPKNPILFSQAIKDLFDDNTLDNWKVKIRGRGSLDSEIKKILKKRIEEDKVDVNFSGKLFEDFATSKVVVSLIETGNYPSQSLFEAMSYGLIPIISNTGNSFEKYNSKETVFCDLTKDDLKEKIKLLVQNIEADNSFFNKSSLNIKKFSKELIAKSKYVNEVCYIYG